MNRILSYLTLFGLAALVATASMAAWVVLYAIMQAIRHH